MKKIVLMQFLITIVLGASAFATGHSFAPVTEKGDCGQALTIAKSKALSQCQFDYTECSLTVNRDYDDRHNFCQFTVTAQGVAGSEDSSVAGAGWATGDCGVALKVSNGNALFDCYSKGYADCSVRSIKSFDNGKNDCEYHTFAYGQGTVASNVSVFQDTVTSSINSVDQTRQELESKCLQSGSSNCHMVFSSLNFSDIYPEPYVVSVVVQGNKPNSAN